jgi:hypothetical protein
MYESPDLLSLELPLVNELLPAITLAIVVAIHPPMTEILRYP